VNDDRRVLVLEMGTEQREMELTMRERKKLTMVNAQAYWKAKKSKKSQMLDDFCESTGYCRRYPARVLQFEHCDILVVDSSGPRLLQARS
jgi:hypothetical protein